MITEQHASHSSTFVCVCVSVLGVGRVLVSSLVYYSVYIYVFSFVSFLL